MTFKGVQPLIYTVDNVNAFNFLKHSPPPTGTERAQLPPYICVKPCNRSAKDGASVPAGSNSALLSLRGGGVEPHQDSKKDSKRRKRRKRGGKDETKEEQDASKEEQSNDDKPSATPEQEPPPVPPPSPPPIVKEILQEEDYYKILGITKQDSDPVKIKKAYRRRAVLTHPDKTGGDRRAFDKVAEAYEVLSDDNKRQLYNKFGKAGLDASGAGASATNMMNAEDLFRSFFGGGPNPFFSQQQQQQQRRNRTVRYQLEVSLEELYNGTTRTVLVSAPAQEHFRSRHQQQAASKRVQVHIPKGSFSNQSIRLSGEMDFDANETPGDIVFLLRERPHPQFTRKGYDLAMSLTISLQEAICGVRKAIRHLDGREITIASAGSAEGVPFLIQSGAVQVLRGQGMPKDASGKEYGDLYVQFQVQMPQTVRGQLTEEERSELGRLLDKLEGKKPTNQQQHKQESDSVKMLQPASIIEFGHASGEPTIPQDEQEDDEEGNGFFSSPFGTRRFFYSSGGTNPFFGGTPGGFPGFDNDEEQVQCKQM